MVQKTVTGMRTSAIIFLSDSITESARFRLKARVLDPSTEQSSISREYLRCRTNAFRREFTSRQSLQRWGKLNPRFTFVKLLSLFAKNVGKQANSNAGCDTAGSLEQVHVTSEKRQSFGLKLSKIL